MWSKCEVTADGVDRLRERREGPLLQSMRLEEMAARESGDASHIHRQWLLSRCYKPERVQLRIVNVCGEMVRRRRAHPRV